MNPEEVCESVRKKIRPSGREIRKLKQIADVISKRLTNILRDYEYIEWRFLGSYARNTWLRDQREIDVFLLFPLEMDNEELEQVGLEIGKRLLDEYEISYAEHPYVRGRIMDVRVEVVPCYRIKHAGEMKSAVDRTPLHHEYLSERIKGLEDEVRLLKQFLKSNGLYGAEHRIKGFSGYLCELLVLHYGGFLPLVRGAKNWKRNTMIHPCEKITEDETFTVIDPVDHKRNVAANLSIDNLGRFVELCQDFLEAPSEDFFFDRSYIPDEKELRRIINDRNTAILVLEFPRPNLVDDSLYPQLDRALRKISIELDKHDFEVMRDSRYATDSRCYLIWECVHSRLPGIRLHFGPPFDLHDHAMKFRKKPRYGRPFIRDGRYMVYVRRKYVKPEECIVDIAMNSDLGKHVTEKIREEFVLYSGVDVIRISELHAHLFEFLSVSI